MELLRRTGINISKNYVFTTPEALNSWQNRVLTDFNIRILNREDLFDIKIIEEKLEHVILEEMKNSLLLMDCTSLTKTATIAMYNLARKYCIPLIYVYEETKELIWLIDIETVKNEVISRLVGKK